MTVRDAELTFGFRHGTDMEPSHIRRVNPEARFVARARLIEGTTFPEMPGDGEEAAVWGILLTLPADPALPQAAATVRTDDGRTVGASILTVSGDVADRDAVIAAARYWELPPDYIRRLGGVEEVVTEG